MNQSDRNKVNNALRDLTPIFSKIATLADACEVIGLSSMAADLRKINRDIITISSIVDSILFPYSVP